MNGLSNLNETYQEYSLAPTDDLIGGQRSRSQQAAEVAKASVLTLGRGSLSCSLLLVF